MEKWAINDWIKGTGAQVLEKMLENADQWHRCYAIHTISSYWETCYQIGFSRLEGRMLEREYSLWKFDKSSQADLWIFILLFYYYNPCLCVRVYPSNFATVHIYNYYIKSAILMYWSVCPYFFYLSEKGLNNIFEGNKKNWQVIYSIILSNTSPNQMFWDFNEVPAVVQFTRFPFKLGSWVNSRTLVQDLSHSKLFISQENSQSKWAIGL